MTTDFLTFHLTPDALRLLPYAAWTLLVIGLVLWLFGTAIARIAVATSIGAGTAALGVLILPRLLEVPPLAGGLLGFTAGLLLGALAFRYLQALTLALCLSIAVAGLYYRLHITAPLPTATAPAQLASQTLRTFAAIPTPDLTRMLVAAAGMASVGVLIALGFPRLTTATITALAGSGLILLAGYALLRVHAQPWADAWPSTPVARYLPLAILTTIGIAIQYRFFGPHADKASKMPASVPSEAHPA